MSDRIPIHDAGFTPTGAVDPRLIGSSAGFGGALRDFGRRVTQGDLGNLPVLVELALVWGYFWSQNHRFISAENLTNLMLQMASGGVIALGVVFVLLLGEIDLAIGATSGFAAAVAVVLVERNGWNPGIAVLVALGVGAAVGLVQGFWVTKLRVPAFIVTLAGQLAWTGALLRVLGKTGSTNVTDQDMLNLTKTFYGDAITYIVLGGAFAVYVWSVLSGQAKRRRAGVPAASVRTVVLRVAWLVPALAGAAWVFVADRGLPIVVIIFFALVIGADLLLRRTRFGRHVYAVGGNAEAARRAGIRVDRVKVIVFVIGSTLGAIGGILAASRLTAVTQSSGGNDVLLTAVAAGVIGGTSLFGGRGSAWAAVLGSLVIFSVNNGMSLLNKSSDVRYIVTGAVLLVAVTIDALARRGRVNAGRA